MIFYTTQHKLRLSTTALLIFVLTALVGCSSEDLAVEGQANTTDTGSTGQEVFELPPIPAMREVSFGPLAVSVRWNDPGSFNNYCGSIMRGQDLDWEPRLFFDKYDYLAPVNYGVSTGDFDFIEPGELGIARYAVGQNVCMRGLFSGTSLNYIEEQCLPLEAATPSLEFDLSRRVDGADGFCQIDLNVGATVSEFDVQAFCFESCSRIEGCAQWDATSCVTRCIEDVHAMPETEDAFCHYAAVNRIDCVNRSIERSCLATVADVRFVCNDFGPVAASWDSGACFPPREPRRVVAVADPAACSPTPENIVSGQIGDALVVTRASSGANSYYIVVDRAAFGEAVQVVNDNPGDPGLSVATSVLAAFAAIDGATADVCRDPGIVAIAFETDGPVPDFGPIEVQLQALQQALDELSTVASAVKKEATNFIFEELFCPAVEDIAGGDTAAGQIRGAVVASLFGC